MIRDSHLNFCIFYLINIPTIYVHVLKTSIHFCHDLLLYEIINNVSITISTNVKIPSKIKGGCNRPGSPTVINILDILIIWKSIISSVIRKQSLVFGCRLNDFLESSLWPGVAFFFKNLDEVIIKYHQNDSTNMFSISVKYNNQANTCTVLFSLIIA